MLKRPGYGLFNVVWEEVQLEFYQGTAAINSYILRARC